MPCEFPDDPRFVLARSIIVDAAALAAGYFADLRSLTVEHKLNGQDAVSIADRAVEDLIRTRIAAAFPDDGFLGEESGYEPGRSGHLWVVDPIDGTSCFLHGLRDWCVSIAVMTADVARLGLIHDPCADELFVAARGRGAFLNGRRIAVDEGGDLGTGLVGVGANFRVPAATVSHFVDALLGAGGMFVRSGSGARMLAHVACGRLVAYYEPHINAWDCMAGLCLIAEAGGWCADFPSGDGLLDGGPVIASAPRLRDDLLRLIAEAGKNGTG
jgi:myo-inositol-1(or 4)-monophosphatase